MTIADEQIILDDVGSYLYQRSVGSLNDRGLPMQIEDDLIPIVDCDMDWFNSLNEKSKGVLLWYVTELGILRDLTDEQRSIWNL